MARHRKFNCGKTKQKSSASQNRHPTLSQYVKSDYEPEMMAHFCVCCGCGKMESTTVLLQMEETSNELFCMACLQDCNPSNEWWGSILLVVNTRHVTTTIGRKTLSTRWPKIKLGKRPQDYGSETCNLSPQKVMAFIYIHVWVHPCIPRYLFPQLIINYCSLYSFTNKVEARQNTTARCMQATDSENFATKVQPKRSMSTTNTKGSKDQQQRERNKKKHVESPR